MTRTFVLLTLIALSSAAPTQEDAIKKDLAELQGTWKISALEINGNQVAVENLASAQVVIKDNQYQVAIGKEKYTVTITLDPSKNPKELDMMFNDGADKDRVARAIYKLDKDSFTLVRNLQVEQRRPSEFGSWPDTNVFMVTWKKQ
jgi:uncharacterized protein (TIGR03067 family)